MKLKKDFEMEEPPPPPPPPEPKTLVSMPFFALLSCVPLLADVALRDRLSSDTLLRTPEAAEDTWSLLPAVLARLRPSEPTVEAEAANRGAMLREYMVLSKRMTDSTPVAQE
jgi:hypothetical protein